MTHREKNRIIRALLDELRQRSPWEGRHADQVAVYAVTTGSVLGLGRRDLLDLRFAATLHDIGKLRWSDLEDPSAEEKLGHPAAGAEIVGHHSWLREAGKLILAHHERLDGSGYPHGSKEIPIGAQIIGACEVVDVCLNGAAWKTDEYAWPQLSATTFDPAIVEALRKAARLIQPLSRTA